MRFSPLLLLAQAAALSSAFLVPPEISDKDLKDLKLVEPIDIGAGLAMSEMSMSRIVRIPCDGCPSKEEGVDTDIVLDFNLPEGDHQHMSLNGIPIFPLEVSGDKPLVAAQMPHDVDTIVYMVDGTKFPQVTLDNSRLITTDFVTDDGAREYTLELSVFAVDGVPVKLEGVQMIVVESPTGELTFGPVRPIPKNETCGASVKCMLAKMMDRIRHMGWGGKKGCKGRKGGKHHGNPVAEGLEGLDMERPPHHDDLSPPRHHHHHHHGPHGHHHHHRPGVFHRIMGQVLLPIFVGIVAGMTVAAIGLVVGHTAVLLFYRLRGIRRERCCKKKGGRRGFFGRRRKHEQEPEAEAEKGLLQEQEQEEPPAYVDDAPEVVVIEKE